MLILQVMHTKPESTESGKYRLCPFYLVTVHFISQWPLLLPDIQLFTFSCIRYLSLLHTFPADPTVFVFNHYIQLCTEFASLFMSM